ncbi:hypothetical protein WJX84_008003 [Apatococcus fuscideae]|uniref:Uncharacterized protein n=1 Tax=Apatococcus fuscideae TaxID=2026836 RepID=A0AAW1SI22_9CHLO
MLDTCEKRAVPTPVDLFALCGLLAGGSKNEHVWSHKLPCTRLLGQERRIFGDRQGEFNEIGHGIALKEVLTQCLQRTNHIHMLKQGQSTETTLQHVDGTITLVAHYGSGFAHEILV